MAIQIASTRGDHAFGLIQESWPVVMHRDREASSYELARKKAETACRVVSDSGAFRTVVGVAYYRLGRFEEAVDALTRASQDIIAEAPLELKQPIYYVGRAIYPVNLAFTAMALRQLGHDQEANALFEQLRVLMQDPRWVKYADAVFVYREAEEVLSDNAPAAAR